MSDLLVWLPAGLMLASGLWFYARARKVLDQARRAWQKAAEARADAQADHKRFLADIETALHGQEPTHG